MARLIRAHEWSGTALGPISEWPQALRTVIRLLLNSRHPMYVFWGPELLCLWNDAYTGSLGPERHPGSLGRPAREVWAEIWPIIGGQIEQVMSGQGATWNENQLVPITRHGRVEQVYWTYGYSPIDDETAAGGVGGVLVVCNETTAQVTTERTLTDELSARAAERDRLAALFENAPSFMAFLAGPEHRIELANNAYLSLIGDRDVLGKPVAQALPEVVGQGYVALLDGVFTSGKAYSSRGARLALRREGEAELSERFVDFIYQPVLDDGGDVMGIFVDGFDTTDRTVAEAQLRQTESLLRSLIDAAPGVIYYKDLQGRMVLANAATLELVGKPWPEIEGRTDREFLDDADQAEAVIANDYAVLASGQTQVLEEFVGEVDGQPRLFLSTKRPFFDDSGTVAGLIGISVDISERKAMERELHALNATLETQISERSAALAEAAEALRQSQKMEAIGQLTGGIAHDFNNMLQGVVSGISLARRRLDAGKPEEAVRFLDSATESAGRAGSLTARLLAFGRRQPLNPRPLDIDELVGGMITLINRTVGPGITLNVDLMDGCWPVISDRNQLENALLNLCINARDAMPDGGEITIATRHSRLDVEATEGSDDAEAGDYVCIAITDTGVGMSPDVLKHAFEPFFTTKPEGQGTGLGLSQIYGFVRQSNGIVRLQSEPGLGTTVQMYLPRGALVSDMEAATPEPQGMSEAWQGHGTATILLVEDEPSIRLPAAVTLRELGYTVLEAADGQEALRLLYRPVPAEAAGPISLLITDIGLPGGLNGRQLAEAARQRLPTLPVLLITGFGGDAKVTSASQAGRLELLVKPFDLATLAERVRGMLSPDAASG
tara:strand:+ start:4777 stop:7293 length:2517 start_codon:yes stop_codon:yes gene_type:complete